MFDPLFWYWVVGMGFTAGVLTLVLPLVIIYKVLTRRG